jgi:hypothetical protein
MISIALVLVVRAVASKENVIHNLVAFPRGFVSAIEFDRGRHWQLVWNDPSLTPDLDSRVKHCERLDV